MAISSLFPQLLWLLFVIYAQTSASKECDPAAIYLDVRTEDISYGEITIRPNRPRDQEVITAQSGQNVTLTCRAPNNNKNNIIVVEWSRADLGEECVLMYRDEQSDPEHQHPSFKNRVDLQDRQMKDGDVSLILKNVTINDTGTYECRVVQRGNNRGKRAVLNNNPISVIYLRVDLPDQTGGHKEDGGKEEGGKEDVGKEAGSVGLIVGLSVSAVLVVAAATTAILFIHRKHKRQAFS